MPGCYVVYIHSLVKVRRSNWDGLDQTATSGKERVRSTSVVGGWLPGPTPFRPLAHKALFRFCENIGQARDFQWQSGRDQIFQSLLWSLKSFCSYASPRTPSPHLRANIIGIYHINMTALIRSHNLTSNDAENWIYCLQLLVDGISKRLIKQS
jgi:hypothetical protein